MVNVSVIVLSVLAIVLICMFLFIMRNGSYRSESFTTGCRGQNFMNADYYTKVYPYYGDEYFKPLFIGKTNLEGVPATPLYRSLY
jgi:hypothetical protein